MIAVQINVEKSYAFLEMRAPDEASAGMSFDGMLILTIREENVGSGGEREREATQRASLTLYLGIMLHGHALKVRRPKDYIPAPLHDYGSGKPSIPMGAIVATNVPDSPYKVSAAFLSPPPTSSPLVPLPLSSSHFLSLPPPLFLSLPSSYFLLPSPRLFGFHALSSPFDRFAQFTPSLLDMRRYLLEGFQPTSTRSR